MYWCRFIYAKLNSTYRSDCQTELNIPLLKLVNELGLVTKDFLIPSDLITMLI